MLAAGDFLAALDGSGFRHLVGVPCSCLASVYQEIDRDPRFSYVAAPNEGSAFAMAAGLQLAGHDPAVLIQNSGFGNLVNPLASVAMPYRIPVLTFMTMRDDEPQHEVMGRCAVPMLDALGLPHRVLPAEAGALGAMFAGVRDLLADGQPAFVLVPTDTFAACGPSAPSAAGAFDRRQALGVLVDLFPDALFVTTVGYISRELFALRDRPENLYLQGAMGHAASVAAGIAVAQPRRRVVVVDGDGSAIMHLGVLSLVGHVAPGNLVHVVLDNGGYESTGGQPSTAGTTAFGPIATACGYRAAVTVSSAGELRAAGRALAGSGPVLAHVRIAARSAVAGVRASAAIRLPDMARRFAGAVRG